MSALIETNIGPRIASSCKRLAAGALAGLTFALAAVAQDAKDPAALSLLDQAAAAAGVESASSLEASGSYILPGGGKVPFRVRADATEVRWEFDAERGLQTVVLNVDSGGGFRDGPDGQSRIALDDEAGWGFERIPIFGLKRWAEASESRAFLLDTLDEEGKSFDRVEVSRTSEVRPAEQRRVIERATRSEILFDRETGLPSRVRYFSHPGDWRIDIAIDLYLSDYRRQGGVEWPHLVEAYFEKTLLWQMAFETVEIGGGGEK